MKIKWYAIISLHINCIISFCRERCS